MPKFQSLLFDFTNFEKPFAYRYQWEEECGYSASQAGSLKAHTRLNTCDGLLPCQWDGCEHGAATHCHTVPSSGTLVPTEERCWVQCFTSHEPQATRSASHWRGPAISRPTLAPTRARSRLLVSGSTSNLEQGLSELIPSCILQRVWI